MVKRVFLFVLTNIAIMVMVSIVLAVLGQLGVLDLAGSQGALLVICAVWGFGASFVSLLLSRWMAKRAHGRQARRGRHAATPTLSGSTPPCRPPRPAGQPADARGRDLRLARGERLRHGPLEEAQPRGGVDRPASGP